MKAFESLGSLVRSSPTYPLPKKDDIRWIEIRGEY